jgi:hypothetical protein
MGLFKSYSSDAGFPGLIMLPHGYSPLIYANNEYVVLLSAMGATCSWCGEDSSLLTLPLSGSQGVWGGEAERIWWPVRSRGLLDETHAMNIITKI